MAKNIFYNKTKNALIFINKNATSEFWDERWETDNLQKLITGTRNSLYWSTLVKKYLPKGSTVLEGGCGTGHLVDALAFWGYKSTGIDYAEKTVALIKRVRSDLDVVLGDVRKLPFEDNSFDGYFSLGVIEHFWDGYAPIMAEIKRVLKPGGYLFLSFPCISRMDKILIWFKRYPLYASEKAPDDFYQFALNIDTVKDCFEKSGFVHRHTSLKGGLLGLNRFHPVFGRLNTFLVSSNIVKRGLSRILTFLLSPLSSHSVLVVFQKT